MRHLVVAAACAALLCGCAPLMIATGITAGKVAAQERPLPHALDDMNVQTEIETKLASKSFKLFRNVDVRVVEGRVLLAGRVQDEDTRIEAGKIAWGIENVREVNNEILVGSKGGIARDLNDFRISQQLRAKLLADYKIASVNYSLETIDGVIYMIGIAQTEDELERVALHARTIAGVKKVVSYVQLKDDPERNARG